MNTTFLLSGGAGRVITAIPAIEKFYRLNPKNNFNILVHGWDNLFWGHPILQQRTFNIEQKGVFDQIIKNTNIKCPEPYYLHSYYNQKTSLAEAFDEEINKTNDHSDLTKPNLYCSSSEIISIRTILQDIKTKKQKNKLVVFQPFGSSTTIVGNYLHDASRRSLDSEAALKLGRMLSEEAVVLYFGPNEFIDSSDNSLFYAKDLPNVDLRFFMTMISECDCFVGIDSVGQHMARAFDKPGLVVMGSTFEKNVSYPGHFKFYRNNIKPTYSPIRFGNFDCNLADRINDNIMDFSDSQINEMYTIVKKMM